MTIKVKIDRYYVGSSDGDLECVKIKVTGGAIGFNTTFRHDEDPSERLEGFHLGIEAMEGAYGTRYVEVVEKYNVVESHEDVPF